MTHTKKNKKLPKIHTFDQVFKGVMKNKKAKKVYETELNKLKKKSNVRKSHQK